MYHFDFLFFLFLLLLLLLFSRWLSVHEACIYNDRLFHHHWILLLHPSENEKKRENKKNCLRIFRSTNTYIHYSSSIRCRVFFCCCYLSSVYMLEKIREKRYCLFFFSLYMFFGILELVYLFLVG
jgi:hypothetical protein